MLKFSFPSIDSKLSSKSGEHSSILILGLGFKRVEMVLFLLELLLSDLDFSLNISLLLLNPSYFFLFGFHLKLNLVLFLGLFCQLLRD